MSDEQTQEVAQETANAESSKDTNLVAEIEKLKSTNERLLAESNKYKTRKTELEEYKQKIDAYEQKKLEETGNWQEMLELERKKRSELEQSLKQRDNQILKSNVFNHVANYAKDAYDVNDLLAQRSYADMIEINEDSLEPTSESVQKFVDTLKADKKYLFKGHKVTSMADEKPSTSKPQTKKIESMTKDELIEFSKSNVSSLF